MFRVLLACICLPWTVHAAGDAAHAPAADRWLTNTFLYPPSIPATARTNDSRFEALHADVVAGYLKIIWPAAPPPLATAPTLFISWESPGHWPARDWRHRPMESRGTQWEAKVPVQDLDLPIVYFVDERNNEPARSPMRVCVPRALGMEEPSRLWWPFLEGFEEGLESWECVSPSPAAISSSSAAKNGFHGLEVSVPAGKRSATIRTTRVRGEHILRRGATGLRFWARAGQPKNRLRLTLVANALTTNQTLCVSALEPSLTQSWQPMDVPFSTFPKLPTAAIDSFVIDCIGQGPCKFFFDDLELLGPWPLAGE